MIEAALGDKAAGDILYEMNVRFHSLQGADDKIAEDGDDDDQDDMLAINERILEKKRLALWDAVQSKHNPKLPSLSNLLQTKRLEEGWRREWYRGWVEWYELCEFCGLR